MAKVSEHFTEDEVSCNCGCSFKVIQPLFIYDLEKARSLAKIPFHINSWCRCLVHNDDVGGKRTSSHLKGYAADIACLSEKDLLVILWACAKAGFRGIGIARDFIHVDNDMAKSDGRLWFY